MRFFRPIFAVSFACCCVGRVAVCAQKSPTPFSTYGEIQGVQKYSSNPFWNKDSPYNQRMPTPIYATGADLNTGDCNRVVGNLIASYCASNDCKKISDVRPTVMVQLSQLPGHNFATSCGGYIDSEFENYKKTYGNVFTNNIVKPATNTQTTQTVQLNNIFAKQPSKYEQGVAERTAELKRLQSANASTPGLTAQDFPKTIDDISFGDRMALRTAGYEPFQNMQVYRDLVVEGEEHFIERQLALLEMGRKSDAETLSNAEYCAKYPLDATRCTQTPGTAEAVLATGDYSVPPSSATPGQPTQPTQTPTTKPSETPVGSFTGRTIGGGRVVVSNKTHGGSCFPAARSKNFTNEILTSGQYESVSPQFEKALITLFRKEGGCGTIKNDPCGYTCYGLGSGPKCMNMDVSKLTRKDAETIYYERFWEKYNFGKLPDVISGDMFLAAVGGGACTAIQQFRKFLGLSKSCKIDDAVVTAVENYSGDIHNNWLDVRQKFLTEVAQRRYTKDILYGFMNSIKIKRENGCHVIPAEPLYRK